MRPASSPPFDDVLRRLEAELDVPYPQRRELLDEIAADLAAAFAAARDRGLGEAPARAAALAALGLDDAARAALADVHRAPVARLLAALPPPCPRGRRGHGVRDPAVRPHSLPVAGGPDDGSDP